MISFTYNGIISVGILKSSIYRDILKGNIFCFQLRRHSYPFAKVHTEDPGLCNQTHNTKKFAYAMNLIILSTFK
ncbi:MAG: hypothetical protein WBZ20_15150, partial [Nitrososphaeraceae archaeon]